MSTVTTLDQQKFVKAFDGKWSLVAVDNGSGRMRVTYRSVAHPDIEWSCHPWHPELVPPLGTVGRLGFTYLTGDGNGHIV